MHLSVVPRVKDWKDARVADRRKLSEINADIEALPSRQKVLLEQAVSSSDRPADGEVARLLAERIGVVRHTTGAVILITLVAAPILLVAFLKSADGNASWQDASFISLTVVSVLGLFAWAFAYRPLRRKEAQLRGEAELSSSGENWVLGALIAWMMTFLVGAVVRALGVDIPAAFGWPLWLLLAWGCKKALDDRPNTGW